MNDARPSNWIRALRALLSAIPIIAGLGAHAVVAQEAADLGLAIADAPDPVAVGGQLTYTITVTNDGPSDATGVLVIDDLPPEVTFISAVPECGIDGPLFCDIGNLATGATATLTIVVTPTSANDQLRNMVRVQGSPTDPNTRNDSDEELTVVSVLPTPPTASNVLISGTAQVGQVLTGRYAYADVDGDLEGASIFRWLRGDTPVADATAQTYTLIAADQGALVSFEVTPVAQSGPSPGLAVISDAVGPVAPPINLPPTASNVLISGNPRGGPGAHRQLRLRRCRRGTPQGASTFRWLHTDGEVDTPIDGATALTYTLVAADEGALIKFEVTPVAQSGISPGLAASAVVGPVVTPGPDPSTPPTASNVLIAGTPRVGQVLTGSYTYADADDDLQGASTFRWLRDNVAIAGATARSYALVAADEGTLIKFKVTPVAQSGPSPGLAATSAQVGPVTPAPTPIPRRRATSSSSV